MTLTSLWLEQREQLEGKYVRQIIKFAGDGTLRDGNVTSVEFRDYLSYIPTDLLKQFINECVDEKFDDNNLVLQDIVNQIGKRLGYQVTDGRYRGTVGQLGFDGLWKFPDGQTVIVEVKMTNTYQINLETLAGYRKGVIGQGATTEECSSILLVIGRDSITTDLEAQIRGSRFAWNVRLISVDALIRLLELKEKVNDPKIIQRISAILIPREFTKLDEIIDILFSTAEDVAEDEVLTPQIEINNPLKQKHERTESSSFHAACVSKIERMINQALFKRSKTSYSTADDTVRITCAISKEYIKGNSHYYWFAFHPYQKAFLSEGNKGFVTFGCGDERTVIMIPYHEFSEWIEGFNITNSRNRFYWHIYISKIDNNYFITRKAGFARILLSNYLLKID